MLEKKIRDNRYRRIISSGIPNLPKHTFLSPFGGKAEEFTIAFLFKINNENTLSNFVTKSILPGFYFPGIGENWEIYLNGKLLRSELRLDNDGQIKEGRTWHNVYFPVDSSHFVSQINLKINQQPNPESVLFPLPEMSMITVNAPSPISGSRFLIT